MNDEQLNELFKAARTVKPDTARAEYGFETRLLARLRAESEEFVPWYGFAWRLIPAFATIVVVVGFWMIAAPGTGLTDIQGAIADDVGERTLVTHFTGD
jgi:hypothetical protein